MSNALKSQPLGGFFNIINCFTDTSEQSNRSNCLNKVPSSASLCYIEILNNLTLQSCSVSVQRSSHGLLLGEDQ